MNVPLVCLMALAKKCFNSLAMQLEQSLNTVYSFRIGCWKLLFFSISFFLFFFFTFSEHAKLWYQKWLLRSDKWASKCSIMIIIRWGCILFLSCCAHFIEMGVKILDSEASVTNLNSIWALAMRHCMNLKSHISRNHAKKRWCGWGALLKSV